MESNQLFEYEKAIAIFMGYKEATDEFKMKWLGVKDMDRVNKINYLNVPILEKNGDPLFPNTINFFLDYSWLMPVVEKINTRDFVTIYADECKIHPSVPNEFETIKVIKEGCFLKDAIFEAVAKYAIWYNLNIKE